MTTTPARKRVTVLHNQGARGGYYQPGDAVAEVYSRSLPADWSLRTPELLAEALFWVFRAAEPGDLRTLNAEEQPLNSAYRNRRLRPFVRGDVLVIGSQAFACGPWGRSAPLNRNELNVLARPSSAHLQPAVGAAT